MGNEGQQPPLSGQGKPEEQGYYSWQYDQNQTPEVHQHLPVVPPSRPYEPPRSPSPAVQHPQMPSRYQEPILDMGTSLGYGQGMEYQYFNAPQPSQPIAQLRQERLQQLREERMRRQQRNTSQDITTLIPKGNKGVKQPPLVPPQMSPSWGPNAPPSVSSQMSPSVPLPANPNNEVLPVRSSTLPSMAWSERKPPTSLLRPATVPAQDTGMIQRVRIGKAALILTGAFIASRFLGLLRTSMFAFVFGTSTTSDAYLQAFLIPDLIFNIVAGGALSSAFIPVFTKCMVGEKDEKKGWHVASSALNLAVLVMMGLAFFAIIFAPQLVPLYNPGVGGRQVELIVALTRIMLLQSILLGAGVIVNAVLNARQDFLLPAVGTVLYNVGLIAGLIPGMYFAFHGRSDATDSIAVYGATWGVVIGAFLQVGVQIPGLFKVGMRYTFAFDWRHPDVMQIAYQMLPRIVNAAMLYVSIFVDRGLILLLGAWAIGAHLTDQNGVNGLITQYYQSLQLVLLPLGIFGMAVSTAAFPTLAENVAKGRLDRVRGTILETLRSILFMSIPSSIGLIVLGFPIIQVLLEHGRFSRAMAESTAVPLAFFSVGLAGLAAVEILTRSFYALRDSRTPVIVSVGQFIFKIALSLLFINIAVYGPQWGMGGLALSTSIAGLLEAVIMFWLLHQRIGDLQLRSVGLFIGRVVLAALAMGLGLLIARFVLDKVIVTTQEQFLGLGGTLLAFIKLLIELFVGTFIYIRGARFLGIEELGPVKRVLDRLKLSWI